MFGNQGSCTVRVIVGAPRLIQYRLGERSWTHNDKCVDGGKTLVRTVTLNYLSTGLDTVNGMFGTLRSTTVTLEDEKINILSEEKL